MRAADAIVSVLEEAGVDVVFGIPGVHNLSLFDGLWASSMRVVVTRHEGAAAHAADGYARATGRPGVVVTTTGPGSANALAGVGEAWAAGSPVLHLTTQVKAADLEAGVQRGILHQSPGQIDGFRPLTRSATTACTPQEAVDLVAAALGAMLDARIPGMPAYVEVPFDLLDGEAEPVALRGRRATASPAPAADIAEAARLLAGARSVVVWVGGGAVRSGAGDALDLVARRLRAPVITTYQGRGMIREDLSVGLPPHEPAVRELIGSADVMLAVGTSFGATDTMNGALRLPERIVRIDVDPDRIGTPEPVVALLGDAHDTLRALEQALPGGVERSEADRVDAIRAAVWRTIAGDPRTAEAAALIDALASAIPCEAIVACDMCVAGYWVGGYLPRDVERTLLYPLGWGTLGFGLPAAVGAAAARTAPVVAVVGDAGLCYYLGELATAREHDLNLTVLCVNDDGYGMLRFDEQRRFGRTFAADLMVPDLVSIAAAFDIPYTEVRLGDASLGAAVARGIEDGGVHLVELRAALYPPRTTSPRWNEEA